MSATASAPRASRDGVAAAVGGPTAHKRKWFSATVLGMVLVVYAVAVLRTAWLCDDAYITFRMVGNLVSGYGPTWNIAERVQACTHPLWMLVLSGLFCVTAHIYHSAIFAGMAFSLAAVLVYALRIARSWAQAIVGVTILAFSKAFVDYSTSGLENPLTFLLLALFLWVYLEEAPVTCRRLFGLSLIAGLGTLNRLDTVLLFGPALIQVWWAASAGQDRQGGTWARRGRLALIVAAGFVPLLAWELFSLVYYGFLLPNTAYAKLGTGIPTGELMRQGVYYLGNSLRLDYVTLPAIVCAVVAGIASRRRAHRFIVAGIVLYVLYTLRIGGDFMSGRFFAAPLLAAVCVLGTMAVSWKAPFRVGIAAAVLLGLLSPHPSLLSGPLYGLVGDNLIDAHGIADERGCYYIFTGLLRHDRNAAHDAVHNAQAARRDGTRLVVSTDTIGMFGYHAGPEVHIVDPFGLADPLLARLPMKPTLKWRIGHFARDLPAGYLDSLRTGRNELPPGGLRSLYDDLRLITRGPLFTRSRWSAIIRRNVWGAS